ncbi:unnamed protein product [Parnassius mnemosyne]|uniref:Uncharacterized protein n=1 Tax=Parnassius mnemosyne TaxID=213953 RepID=A0AAV1LTY0_9NEOP
MTSEVSTCVNEYPTVECGNVTPMSYVNTQRRIQRRFSLEEMDADFDFVLLNELRQFRSEMTSRLESQANAIKNLQDQFSQTKADLEHLIKLMTVVEEKVESKLSQNISPQIINKDSINPPCTLANIVRQATSTNTLLKKRTNSRHISYTQNMNSDEATKLTQHTAQVKLISTPMITESISTDSNNKEDHQQAGWKTQKAGGADTLSMRSSRSAPALAGPSHRKSFQHLDEFQLTYVPSPRYHWHGAL